MHFSVPPGHHITLRSELEEGIIIERKYTPTFKNIQLPDDIKTYKEMDDGNIHLIIKTYEKGAFTPFLSRLPLGLFFDYSKHILIFKNFYTINIHFQVSLSLQSLRWVVVLICRKMQSSS